MKSPRFVKRLIAALAIGMAVTFLVLLFSLTSPYEQLELKMLDLRFLLSPKLLCDPAIIHVDIDDTSIEQCGRWPWPRTLHAQLIDGLTSCGARTIAFDVLFVDPSQPILEDPNQLTAQWSARINESMASIRQTFQKATSGTKLPEPEWLAQIGRERFRLEQFLQETLTQPDEQLAEAIRKSGRVYLPFFASTDVPAYDTPLLALLKQNFHVTLAEASRQLTLDRETLRKQFAAAQRYLLTQASRQSLSAQSNLSFGALADELEKQFNARFDRTEQQWIGAAQADWKTQEAFKKQFASGLFPNPLVQFPKATELIPPLPVFLPHLRGSGFVNIEPDPDGVLRRVTLFWEYGGALFWQNFFRVACDELKVKPQGLRLVRGPALELQEVQLPGKSKTAAIRIPLDSKGRMLIHWAGEWNKTFFHLPARVFINLKHLEEGKEEWVNSLDEKYRRGERRHFQNQLAAARAQYQSRPSQETRQRVELLEKQVQIKEEELFQALKRDMTRLESLSKLRPDDEAVKNNLALLQEDFSKLEEWAKEEQDLRASLTRFVQDKICIIGLTATATHDMRATPLEATFPGVGVHSNLINTIFQQKFIWQVPHWINLLLFILIGLVFSFFLSQLKPLHGVVTLAAFLAGLAGMYLAAFNLFGWWLEMTGPALICVFSFAGITSYRYFTEEKEKRWVRHAFQHYLSQNVVAEILNDPSKLKLGGERRTLSVLFSDIRGFTSFSETHSPEEVVRFLNEYMDAMTQVIFEYNGTLDKFVGDEVMAIFGAPGQHDVERHAESAVRCAVAMNQKLLELQETWRRAGREVLHAGIGINSGEMVVGNMGSTQRMDYTVIGDNVNLAARLCSAAEGSQILITRATLREVEKLVEVRPLEPMAVKGKALPVEVFEVVRLK